MLLTEQMHRSVGEAARLFGLSRSAFVRSALVKSIAAAHDVQPSIDLPRESAS